MLATSYCAVTIFTPPWQRYETCRTLHYIPFSPTPARGQTEDVAENQQLGCK